MIIISETFKYIPSETHELSDIIAEIIVAVPKQDLNISHRKLNVKVIAFNNLKINKPILIPNYQINNAFVDIEKRIIGMIDSIRLVYTATRNTDAEVEDVDMHLPVFYNIRYTLGAKCLIYHNMIKNDLVSFSLKDTHMELLVSKNQMKHITNNLL